MRRRRNFASGLSLFAFQDIITGVAGVMLFILMLLVVQLAIQHDLDLQSITPPTDATVLNPSITPSEIDELARAIYRQNKLYESNKATLKFLIDAKVDSIDAAIERHRERASRLQDELLLKRTEFAAKQKEFHIASESDQARSLPQEIDALMGAIREIHVETLQWQDSKRVSLETDQVVSNLYLFDVHGTHISMSLIPPDDREYRMILTSGTTGEIAAKKLMTQYEKLNEKNQDPQRRIVVLIRPSAAVFSNELILTLKNSGFAVALELLETDAELFRKSRKR